MQVMCTSTRGVGSSVSERNKPLCHHWHQSRKLKDIELLCSVKTDASTENSTTTAREQQSLKYALLTTEWTPNVRDACGKVLCKRQQEVQADLGSAGLIWTIALPSTTRLSIQLSRLLNLVSKENREASSK